KEGKGDVAIQQGAHYKATVLMTNAKTRYEVLQDAIKKSNWKQYESAIKIVSSCFTTFLVKDTQTNCLSIKDQIISEKPDFKNFIEFYINTNHSEVIENIKKEEAFLNEEKKVIADFHKIKVATSVEQIVKDISVLKQIYEKNKEQYEKRGISHAKDFSDAEEKVQKIVLENVFKVQFFTLKMLLFEQEKEIKENSIKREETFNKIETKMNEVVVKSQPNSTFLNLKEQMTKYKPETGAVYELYDKVLEMKNVQIVEKKVPQVQPKVEVKSAVIKNEVKGMIPIIQSGEYDISKIARAIAVILEKNRFPELVKTIEKSKTAKTFTVATTETYFNVMKLISVPTDADPNFCALELKDGISKIKPEFAKYFTFLDTFNFYEEFNGSMYFTEAKEVEEGLKQCKKLCLEAKDFTTCFERVNVYNKKIEEDNGRMSKFNLLIDNSEIVLKLKTLFLEEFCLHLPSNAFSVFAAAVQKKDMMEVYKISKDVDMVINKPWVRGYKQTAWSIRNDIIQHKRESKNFFDHVEEIRMKSKKCLGFCAMPMSEMVNQKMRIENEDIDVNEKVPDFTKMVKDQIKVDGVEEKTKFEMSVRSTGKKWIGKESLTEYIKLVQLFDKSWTSRNNLVTMKSTVMTFKNEVKSKVEYLEEVDRLFEAEQMSDLLQKVFDMNVIHKLLDKVKMVKTKKMNIEIAIRNGQILTVSKSNDEVKQLLQQVVVSEKSLENFRTEFLRYCPLYENIYQTLSESDIQKISNDIENEKEVKKITNDVQMCIRNVRTSVDLKFLKETLDQIKSIEHDHRELLSRFKINFAKELEMTQEKIEMIFMQKAVQTIQQNMREMYLIENNKNHVDAQKPFVCLEYVKKMLLQNLSFSVVPTKEDEVIFKLYNVLDKMMKMDVCDIPKAIQRNYEKFIVDNSALFDVFEKYEMYRDAYNEALEKFDTKVITKENVVEILEQKVMFVLCTLEECGVLTFQKVYEIKAIVQENQEVLNDLAVLSKAQQVVSQLEEKVKAKIPVSLCEWFICEVGRSTKLAEYYTTVVNSQKFEEQISQAKKKYSEDVFGVNDLHYQDYIEQMKTINKKVEDVLVVFNQFAHNNEESVDLIGERQTMLSKNNEYLKYVKTAKDFLKTTPLRAREQFICAKSLYEENIEGFNKAKYTYDDQLKELDITTEDACFFLLISNINNAQKSMREVERCVEKRLGGQTLKNEINKLEKFIEKIEDEKIYPFNCLIQKDRILEVDKNYLKVFAFYEKMKRDSVKICKEAEDFERIAHVRVVIAELVAQILKNISSQNELKKSDKEKTELFNEIPDLVNEVKTQLLETKKIEEETTDQKVKELCYIAQTEDISNIKSYIEDSVLALAEHVEKNDEKHLERLAEYLEKAFVQENSSYVHPFNRTILLIKSAMIFIKTFQHQNIKGIQTIKNLFEKADKFCVTNDFEFDEIEALNDAISALYFIEGSVHIKLEHQPFTKICGKTQFENAIKFLESRNKNTQELTKKLVLLSQKDKTTFSQSDFIDVTFKEHYQHYFTKNNEEENTEMVILMKKYLNYVLGESNEIVLDQTHKELFLNTLNTTYENKEKECVVAIKKCLEDIFESKLPILEFCNIDTKRGKEDIFYTIRKFTTQMNKTCFTLEMVYDFFDISFEDLPAILKEEIEVYNTIIMLYTCGQIECIKFMNKQEGVDDVYINYNNNLILKLQTIVKTLQSLQLDFAQNSFVIESIKEALIDVHVDQSKLVLYTSELKFVEKFLAKTQLKDLDDKFALPKTLAIETLLRSNYSFLNEVREFVSNVDNFVLLKKKEGFLPNVLYIVESTVPLVNRTPQTDKQFMAMHQFSDNELYNSEISGIQHMHNEISYNFKANLVNFNYAIINSLIAQNYSDMYQYSKLMIDTLTQKDDTQFVFSNDEKSLVHNKIRTIFEKFGCSEKTRMFDVKMESTINCIAPVISFVGYQLDCPRVFPSENYFGASIPKCQYTAFIAKGYNFAEKISATVFLETYKEALENMQSTLQFTKKNNLVGDVLFTFIGSEVQKCFNEICTPLVKKYDEAFFKSMYQSKVDQYTDKVHLSGNGEAFDVIKTERGFQIKVQLPGHAKGNSYNFEYVLNKTYDDMLLIYEDGQCVRKSENEYFWSYKNYGAFKTQKKQRYQYDQSDINLPSELLTMISFIGKMEDEYPAIDKKIAEDFKYVKEDEKAAEKGNSDKTTLFE
ncbi:sporulation-specific protein, putative, partial [Entamoeba invadens IP1]